MRTRALAAICSALALGLITAGPAAGHKKNFNYDVTASIRYQPGTQGTSMIVQLDRHEKVPPFCIENRTVIYTDPNGVRIAFTDATGRVVFTYTAIPKGNYSATVKSETKTRTKKKKGGGFAHKHKWICPSTSTGVFTVS